MEYLTNVRYHKNMIPTFYQVSAMQRYSESLAKSTAYAPDANLAAADNTSSYYAFERKFLGVVMNLQPGMMYWNGGDGDDDKVDWTDYTPTQVIEHTMEAIRGKNQNLEQFIPLDELFFNIPNESSSITTGAYITADGNEMFVKMVLTSYSNTILDLYKYDAYRRMPEVGPTKHGGVMFPGGVYDKIIFYSAGIPILNFSVKVEVGKDNTGIFDNYIFEN